MEVEGNRTTRNTSKPAQTVDGTDRQTDIQTDRQTDIQTQGNPPIYRHFKEVVSP